MFEGVKRKLSKRKARRITQEYPYNVDSFNLTSEGKIEFANWSNPLVKPVSIDQPLVDFFKKFIQKGDLVIDIGANIGDTTVPMALAAGASGLTLGFDPNPLVYKILKKNASLNPDKQRIIPLQHAITVREEEFFYVSSEASFGNGGISSTEKSHHGKFVYPEKIKGINLEQYLESNHPDQVSKLTFIKVDAEGYDKEILKSISGLLKKHQPFIIAESFGKSSASEKAELFDVVHKLGYEVFYFEDFHVDTSVIKITNGQEMSRWKKTMNIYCVPENRELHN